jgi:crotonobetainyl-CoA:carnitine CoA-transferase CaiB-like acyl-CoA transferase
MSASGAPLAGVKVLDLTRVLSGPFASMMLADLGADVLKVERPGRGDDTRAFGPPFAGGVSTYFLSINRGKRSLVLDLKDPADRETCLALARRADVLLENFRPGVLDRLGLGWEVLREENPRLIYCAISGFGRARPGAGYDLMIQGLSGIPYLTGDGQTPWKCGTSVADLVTGMNAAQGVLAALFRRERTGAGGLVDVSMIDSQRALLSYHASAWLNAGIEPAPRGNAHPSIHPYQAYRAADGWINLAIANDDLFRRFCELAGVAWHTDERFATNPSRVAHRAALDALLEPVIAGQAIAWWSRELAAAGVPCGPMNTVPQALADLEPVVHDHPEDPGASVRSLPPGYTLSGAPRAADRRAPRLGEHSAQALADWLGPE